MSNAETIVFYHNPCLDGVVAAWAVTRRYPGAVAVPLSHGRRIECDISGKHVMFVDITPCRADLEACLYKSETVTILDHHATANASIEQWLSDGLDPRFEFVFDAHKSGAGLAWDQLHGNSSRPWIVNYVEDHDLWKHVLPGTKEVNSFLSITLGQSPSIETVELLLSQGLEFALAEGSRTLPEREELIAERMKQSKLYRLPGLDKPVPGVECPRSLVSDVLNRLSVGHALAFAWRDDPNGFVYSFRNSNDGMDLSLWVPQTFGEGGGHPHASGLVSAKFVHEDL